MFLRQIAVRGFRSAAEQELTCEFPGRFSLLLGANNVGKTTIADAVYLAHPRAFRSWCGRLWLFWAPLRVRSTSSSGLLHPGTPRVH